MEHIIYFENNQEMFDKTNKLVLNENDTIVCIRKSDKDTHKRIALGINRPIDMELNTINFEAYKPLGEYKYKYNYHDRFR